MSITEREKLAFVRAATTRMALDTFDCICSVIGVDDDDSGALVGTGFRIQQGQRRWLLTAMHVVTEVAERSCRLAVTFKRGEPPVEVSALPVTDSAADIAAFRLPSVFSGAPAWPIERIEPPSDMISRDFLFTHGFPGTDARFSRLLDAHLSRSFPYGVMRRDENLPRDLAEHQFGIDFEPNNLESIGDEIDLWRMPHGLSGSPVWRIGAPGVPVEHWSPNCAKLIGILTQWRPDHHLLVASTADRVLELLE